MGREYKPLHKNTGKGYSARENSFAADARFAKSGKGGFSFKVVSTPNGGKYVDRKMSFANEKPRGAPRSPMDSSSFVNARNDRDGRTQLAHGIADKFYAPGRARNLTYTTKKANQLDTAAEAKMRVRMRNKPGEYTLSVRENIDATGRRVEKVSTLQRSGSPNRTEYRVKSTDG